MAQEKEVAMPVVLGGLTLLVAVGMGVLLVVLSAQRPQSGDSVESKPSVAHDKTQESVEHLFATASGLGREGIVERRKAARLLAKRKGAEPWIVLLLLSYRARLTDDEEERQRQESRQQFELPVVAAVVESLPKETDRSVLWALTFLLGEERKGIWSSESGTIVKRKNSHSTRPIRELARVHLKNRLGVDNKWDASAWRASIVEQAKHEARKADESTTASQPATAGGLHKE